MWMYPMLWVVLGSVALAAGTTMTLMPMLEDNIAPRTAEVMGLFLGVGGIVIGLVIASLQMRQSNRMDRIISGTKHREDRRKMYYLHRIHSSTSNIKDSLETLQSYVNNYANDRKPETWQIARNKAKRSKELTQELGRWIRDDFTKIVDLVESQRLGDKFEVENIYFTEWVLIDALRINPEYDEDLVQLRKDIVEQIQKLNDTVSSLEKEMPKDEV
jgi:hypothetical protein